MAFSATDSLELEQNVKISVDNLQSDQLLAYDRTLTSILSTSLAERTFAQIIDRLPTVDYIGFFPTYTREIRENIEPSAEAMEAARGLRDKLGSCISVVDAKGRSPEQRKAELKHPQTFLMHEDYHYWQQYPKGVADIVGYWAEYHLFGGVVLFDRGESGIECNGVYLHPVGRFKIFQISKTQLLQFSDYVQQLVSKSTDIPPFFPLKVDKYTYRVDPFDAMSHNIYRDRYGRVIPDERSRRCVMRAEDDPVMQDVMAELDRPGRDPSELISVRQALSSPEKM